MNSSIRAVINIIKIQETDNYKSQSPGDYIYPLCMSYIEGQQKEKILPVYTYTKACVV